MDRLLGMLLLFSEPADVICGWSGVSCLLNFSLFLWALCSFFSLLSAMLTCFLSPEI